MFSRDRKLFTNEKTSANKKYDKTLICKMMDFLIDNIGINIEDICFGNVLVSPWVPTVYTVSHSWLAFVLISG